MKNKAFFDIGGQSVKYKINNDQISTFSTIRKNKEFVISRIAKIVSDNNVDAIYISSPGAINTKTGFVLGLSAIKDYADFNLYEELKKVIGKEVSIIAFNDANAAMLGAIAENKKVEYAALVSIGTGIGGALWHKELVIGKNGMAGEFGYILNGESTASAWGLLNGINKELNWDFKTIYDAKLQISIYELKAYQTWLNAISDVFVKIYYFLDPEVIFVSGGISHDEKIVWDIQKKTNAKLHKTNLQFNVKIKASNAENLAILGLEEYAKREK